LLSGATGHFVLTFEATGLILIFFAMAYIPWFILFFIPAFIVASYTTQIFDNPALQQFALSGAGLVVGAALILGLGAYAVPRIFQRGDDGHWNEYARLRRVVGTIGGEFEQQNCYVNAWTASWFSILPDGYASFFKPGKLRSVTPMRRVLLALGSGFHGRGVVVLTAFTTLAVAIGVALEHWQWIHVSAKQQEFVRWMAVAYCVFPLFGYVQQIINSIYRTRREQALVRLAPAAPAAANFNALLYPALLKHFMLVWSASCLFGLISFSLLDGSMVDALPLLSCCAVYLLLAPCIVQNYAAMKSPETSSLIVAAILSLHALILGFVGLRYFVYPLPWPLLGIICAAAAVIAVRLRVRKMNQAAVAFPAGRFA
jgi:hypothetical protein